ncbi:zinc finger protein 225-like [Rhinatrema bivittatum]|uniref:zinc finger protein 225-like n=1 Tax=Rhinatrema bivittatum TaxID=194408 RepID=UPI00112910DE|nr:zinc finger protein 225-like [Rhinatrema bivittatum]
MKENYESLSFLEMGPQRTDRDLLSRIQQEEQSFAQELQELERELAYSYIGNEDIERETRKENREEHPMGFGLISRQSRNVYENISRRTERGETSQTWQASGKKQRNSARDSLDEVSACERRDRELLNILEHRRHLRAERPFQNNNSDQKTSSLHQREGKEKKSFHCDTCGRSFNSKFSLSLHQRSHTGERPFPCSVCGKCFKQKLSLKLHQRIHTLEKPFLCTECKKTFCRKESLVIHQRVHIAQEQGYLQIAREHAYSTRKRLKPEERLRRRSPERFANDHAYCTEQQLTQQIQKCADMQRPPPAEEREGAQTAAECPAVIEKHLGSCEPASSEGENVKN